MKSKNKIKAGRYTLVVVAHPDDEAIFFGTTIMQSKLPVHVVCVTDGNADGMGEKRQLEFAKSSRKLGAASSQCLNLPDNYEVRLDRARIGQSLVTLPKPHTIFTHGPLGEYGHPHHQDVSLAVHETFKGHKKLFACAMNVSPDLTIKGTAKQFALKAKIFSEIYFNETKRFINMVPCNHIESFCRYKLAEVAATHRYLSKVDAVLNEKPLKKLKWFKPYFELFREAIEKRRF